nr:hypothetical protein [Bradyrhizobium sp. CSS354]
MLKGDEIEKMPRDVVPLPGLETGNAEPELTFSAAVRRGKRAYC